MAYCIVLIIINILVEKTDYFHTIYVTIVKYINYENSEMSDWLKKMNEYSGALMVFVSILSLHTAMLSYQTSRASIRIQEMNLCREHIKDRYEEHHYRQEIKTKLLETLENPPHNSIEAIDKYRQLYALYDDIVLWGNEEAVLRLVEMSDFLVNAALDLNRNNFEHNTEFIKQYSNLQHGLILSLIIPDSKDVESETIIDEAELILKDVDSKLKHKIEELEKASKAR